MRAYSLVVVLLLGIVIGGWLFPSRSAESSGAVIPRATDCGYIHPCIFTPTPGATIDPGDLETQPGVQMITCNHANIVPSLEKNKVIVQCWLPIQGVQKHQQSD